MPAFFRRSADVEEEEKAKGAASKASSASKVSPSVPLLPPGMEKSDAATAALSFRLLGLRRTIPAFKVRKLSAAFDVDGSGVLDVDEYSKFLAAERKAAEDERRAAPAAKLLQVQLLRLLVFGALAALGCAATAGGVLLSRPSTYSEVVQLDLSLRATAQHPACGGSPSAAQPVASAEAAPMADHYFELSSVDAARSAMEILGDESFDLLRFELQGASPPREVVREVHYFSQTVYLVVHPYLLRVFTLNAFRLKMARVVLRVAADECTARSGIWSHAVTVVDHFAAKARGGGGVTAVESAQLPRDALRQGGSFLGWVRYACDSRVVDLPSAEEARGAGDAAGGGAAPLDGADEPPAGVLRINPMRTRVCVAGPSPALGRALDGARGADRVLGATVVFLGLNLLVALCALGYAAFLLRPLVVDMFAASVVEIGPHYFINRCGGGASVSDFSAHLLDGAGPLVFADFLVSNPHACTARFADGAKSAALHWLIVAAPSVPLALAAAMLGCALHDNFDELYEELSFPDAAECSVRPAQRLILLALVAKDALALLYSAAWYLDLPWRLQSPLRKLALAAWVATCLVSGAYLVQVTMWLALFALVKPATALAQLALLGTPVAYAYVTVNALARLRDSEQVRGLGALGSAAAAKVEATLGLRTADIIAATVSGAALLAALVVWALLGLGLLTREGHVTSTLVPALGTVGAAVQKGRAQVAKVKARAEKLAHEVGAGIESAAKLV